MQSARWLELHLAGFTPRQLAACSQLGENGLYNRHLSIGQLRGLGVRTACAEKWTEHLRGQGPIGAHAERSLAWCQSHNWQSVHFCHQHYPALLAQSNSPPLLLYVCGNLALLNRPSIAIIGARNPTPQGAENAAWFARELARAGLVVVSGLAYGVDAHCHRAALETGTSLAVMGTGMDSVYPRQHQRLAQQLAEQGALLSELPLGSKPLAGHFPRRNRIISGMSLGALVIEASIKSGSLITARYALDANREVFAIPGPIVSSLSQGCHHLIKEGAQLVDHPQNVLDTLAIAGPVVTEPLKLDPSQLSPDLRAILEHMGYSQCSVDGLCEALDTSASRINSAMIELELEGYVHNVPGGYVRVGGRQG